MSTSLTMRGIQKKYGSLQVLSDFDLAVAEGEFVTFLGPSGSGKTTALKLIAGFETPTAGEIRLGDRSIVDVPPYERGIGMVFQNYALFPHMTVYENVAFPMTVRKMARDVIDREVARALALVHIAKLGDRYPSQLSGGQQQRVALARAIGFGPGILLMDEPLGALDRNLREHMKTEIMQIQKALNVTVIFVTHDQDEALTMSDRIAVINDGRIVQLGDSKSIYAQPRNRFVAAFIGESNLLPCRVVSREARNATVRIDGLEGEGTHVAALSGEVGGDACLFIRPEVISILPAAAALPQGASAIAGVVTRRLFLGEATKYTVRAGAHDLTVREQNRGQDLTPPGTAVHLVWPHDAALVIA